MLFLNNYPHMPEFSLRSDEIIYVIFSYILYISISDVTIIKIYILAIL